MKRRTQIKTGSLFLIILALFTLSAAAASDGNQKRSKNKKKDKTTVAASKKQTAADAYRKLLPDDGSRKAEGMFTLHKRGDDVYIEIPVAMMDRELLLGASVIDISDYGESSEGMKPVKPRRVAFRSVDSLVHLTLLDRTTVAYTDDTAIDAALRNSGLPPVLETFPIAAWSPDSGAVVIKGTKFFINGSDQFSPKDPQSYNSGGGIVGRSYKFMDKSSFVKDIAAYDDNVSVITTMTYEVTGKLLGLLTTAPARPVTATMRITFFLPDQATAAIRQADPRIGTAVTPYTEYISDSQGTRLKYMATRWRLEPADSAAYSAGYATRPVKPVVFYLDPNFPESWKSRIIAGVESWNRAFREAGFIDALRVEEGDSLTANDIKHSSIRYIATPSQTIRSSVWTDPRTGEIVSANIYISHDIVKRIRDNRLFQTGAADPRARNLTLHPDLLGESIEGEVARAVGFCLGLSANLAGSYAVPVDSLQSVSFTQEYGISSSIMDELPYNFIASEYDVARGVRLSQTSPGVYDRFVIKWLYGPAGSVDGGAGETMVAEKVADPSYRYGAKESSRYSYDPRSIGQDIGNDPFVSAQAGIDALAVAARNLDEWLDAQDYDYGYRADAYRNIQARLNEYIRSVMANIGGLYINERYADDNVKAVVPVSREMQRQSLKWVLGVVDDLDWLDDSDAAASGMLSAYAGIHIRGSVVKLLLKQIDRLPLNQIKNSNPYTRSDAYGDISKFLFADMAGKRLTDYRMAIDREFVNTVIQKAGYVPPKAVRISNADSSVAAFGQTGIMYNAEPDERHMMYGLLMGMCESLKRCSAQASDFETRSHYESLLFNVRSALSLP